MRYRLVCLDAGFTLLAPRRTLTAALQSALAEHGHTVSKRELHRAWEVADRWFWDDYHRPDNDSWNDDERIDAIWRTYHSLMLHELGLEDLQHKVLDAILTAQYRPDSWELYPDVLPTLAELRAAGLHLGIISDWGSNLLPIVEGLGLDRELDFVLASGAEGVSKPDPAFYRLAAARAGVPPGEALMVGDSYRADVEGARSAGMEGFLLARAEWRDRRDRREAPPEGVTVISSLAELPALVVER